MLKLHIELEYTPHQNAPRGAECGLRRGSMGSSIPIRTLLYTGEYQPHMNHDNYENAGSDKIRARVWGGWEGISVNTQAKMV